MTPSLVSSPLSFLDEGTSSLLRSPDLSVMIHLNLTEHLSASIQIITTFQVEEVIFVQRQTHDFVTRDTKIIVHFLCSSCKALWCGFSFEGSNFASSV